MAGYSDTRQLIIDTLMGRPAGTEIQPEDHQAFALALNDYIRNVELNSGNAFIGFAQADTVPIQSDNGQCFYISTVPPSTNIVYANFIDSEGNPISVTTPSGKMAFVTLIWNTRNWDSQITIIETNWSQVLEDNIASGAVTGPKIAPNSISTSKIIDGTIQSTDLNPNAFDETLSTPGKIAPADVVGSKLTELDKELNEVTENIVTPIKTERSYILANGNISNTLDAYSIYSINVNAGEQYRIIGTSLVGNAKRYAIYSSETPSSESCLMVSAESVDDNYDVLLEMPENAVLLVVTYMTANEASVVIKQRVVKNKIDFVVNAVEQINQSIYYEVGENVDASVQSEKYILSTGEIGSLGAYSLKVIQVKQGEKYRIVGNGMVGSTKIYGIYKNETMDATTMLIVGNTVGNYESGNYDEIVTIPYGGTTLAVAYMSSNPSSAIVTKIVEKSKIEDITTLNAHIDASSMYCDIKNQQLILNYRYHGKIIQLTLKPTGGNNLFDFNSFAYKISDNAALSDLESGFSLVTAGGTDWHAPFIVESVNNVDGDNISDGVYRVYFTGGNHQYNNSGGGSTSTARLVSLAFFVDGKSVSDFRGYCTNIRIEWVNNVQGYNTTKANGTGREILQERHIMELGGGEIKERIILTPLEDIKISLWYGVQAFAQNVNSIEFIGSDNRFTTNSYNINSISKKCRRMQLNRDSIGVGIEIDESLDLGLREKITANNNFGAFRSGDKYYCQIINASVAETYAANANYYLNCKWFFD